MASRFELKFRKETEAKSGTWVSLGAFVLLCGVGGELAHLAGANLTTIATGEGLILAARVSYRHVFNTALEKWRLGIAQRSKDHTQE